MHGHPLKISELLKDLPGVASLERVALFSPQEIKNARRAIEQAFRNQLAGAGFSMVEILSPCPTYLGLAPAKAMDWVRDVMAREFPLGRIK